MGVFCSFLCTIDSFMSISFSLFLYWCTYIFQWLTIVFIHFLFLLSYLSLNTGATVKTKHFQGPWHFQTALLSAVTASLNTATRLLSEQVRNSFKYKVRARKVFFLVCQDGLSDDVEEVHYTSHNVPTLDILKTGKHGK